MTKPRGAGEGRSCVPTPDVKLSADGVKGRRIENVMQGSSQEDPVITKHSKPGLKTIQGCGC